MKTYTGIIEDMGDLVDIHGRGGKIEFLIIGKETFRRIGCPRDVFAFMKIGMTATIYVHSMPLRGKAILGVKDMVKDRKFMASHSGIIASCIMGFITLGLLFILPSLLMESWSIWMVVPVIPPAILYYDYVKAKSLT